MGQAETIGAWRQRGQVYRLEGEECPHCGEKIFPPRDICPECKKLTVESTRVSFGVVKVGGRVLGKERGG